MSRLSLGWFGLLSMAGGFFRLSIAGGIGAEWTWVVVGLLLVVFAVLLELSAQSGKRS